MVVFLKDQNNYLMVHVLLYLLLYAVGKIRLQIDYMEVVFQGLQKREGHHFFNVYHTFISLILHSLMGIHYIPNLNVIWNCQSY